MMTKENLKELVEQIKRMAQAAPPPPAGAVLDSGGQPSGVRATNPTGGGLGNAGVIDMQKAIIDLAKDVASQIDSGQEVPGNDPREQRRATGRDTFGTFFAENY